MRSQYSVTHEKPVISVSVSASPTQGEVELHLDNADPKTWKTFHCPVCGFVAFEYQNSIRVVQAGGSGPIESGKGRVQCKRCKTLYVIQT